MKKTLLTTALAVFLAIGAFAQAQIFNSAETLDQRMKQIGFNPYVQIHPEANPDSHSYLGGNFYFGYGFAQTYDVNVKIGMHTHNWDNRLEKYAPARIYIGVDFEKTLFKTGRRADPGFLMSLSLGGHAWDDQPGADLTINATYMFSRRLYVFLAIDTDFEIQEKINHPAPPSRHNSFYGTLPLGLEYYSKRRTMSIMIEAGIPLFNISELDAPYSNGRYQPDTQMPYRPYTIGAGLNFYFKGKSYS